MAELNYKETWGGEYRSIHYEIVHWRLGWNYYLSIPVAQLPSDIQPQFNLRSRIYKLSDDGQEHITLDYESAPIISDLDWHGGITLYEKQRDERGKVIGYQLGCDYMHSWDEGKHYDLPSVRIDAEHSIDKLWELVPSLKLRCAWNGKYYNQDDVYYTNKGVCVALENKQRWETALTPPSKNKVREV